MPEQNSPMREELPQQVAPAFTACIVGSILSHAVDDLRCDIFVSHRIDTALLAMQAVKAGGLPWLQMV